MNHDVIIIGAGLGGLTAGAKLAREGKKVLLIEQHSRPGGCATTFKRGDYTLEVGLHEMDGPSPGDIKSRIFNELEVNGNVEFVNVPEFYHFSGNNLEITIPHDPEEAAEILCMKFPDEKEGIRTYFDQILNPRKKPLTGENSGERSLGEFLDSIITSEELKLVLLGNLGYFHDDPYSISLNYYSIAQGSYFKSGASYIRGGSQKLSDHLAKYIRDHNGEVLFNHIVTGLIAEGTRLKGVIYRKKKDISSNTITAQANEIIANNAIPAIEGLAPEKYRKSIFDKISDQKPGASMLTVYLGFKTSLKQLNHYHYSTFIFDSSVKRQSDIVINNKADFHTRSFTFVDYGQIDSGLAHEGKSVGAVCCIDYLNDWELLASEEYETKKEETARIIIQRLEKLIPGISSEIEYYEVATPATIKRYTLNSGGAVYGFAQIPDKPTINLSGVFDNLHIASAWGKTGGGFSGAIIGGFLCAINILRKR
jgi:phytoene dehydrogenase-like protein